MNADEEAEVQEEQSRRETIAKDLAEEEAEKEDEQAQTPKATETSTRRVHARAQINPKERVETGTRNIIPAGMKRFATTKLEPQQPWERLSSRVICVLGQNPSHFTLNGTNCYLIGTGPERILVDTGEGQDYGGEQFIRLLSECMQEVGCRQLQCVLITHGHYDHYGGLELIINAFGNIPVYKVEGPPHEMIADEIDRRGLNNYLCDEKNSPIWTQSNPVTPPLLEKNFAKFAWTQISLEMLPRIYAYHRQHADFMRRLENEYDYRKIKQGDVISTEGATIRCLPMPGHTDDHCCFLLDEEHALFTGDAVLGHGTTVVWDLHDYVKSLRRMLALRPTRLYPAHGPIVRAGTDLLERYIIHREQREKQVWDALSRSGQPVTSMDLVKRLYGETAHKKWHIARENVDKILRQFEKDGSAQPFLATAKGMEAVVMDPKIRRFPPKLLWIARGRASL